MKKLTIQMQRPAVLAAFFTLFCFFAGAQKVQSTLALYADKYAQERAYLHYDKSVYAAGETVWFKAYLMEGILPAQDSKTLYIDWVDAQGAVLAHVVTPIEDAVASGQFDIPTDYSGAFIHVRAYTKWMLNFDSAFLYNKDIRILGKSQNNTIKPVAATSVLQFFPEGGDVIAGIRNKMAFLSTDQWGRPVSISGVVQTDAGATVTTFASQHDGMGFFYMAPQPGVAYSAKWKDAKGTAHTTPLPAAKSNGVALQIELQDTKRRFTLTRTADVPEPLKQLHILGTMDENLAFQTDVDLTGTDTYSALIPTAALPTGILTITVFDAAWNAVAERITFVKNNDYFFTPELSVEHWGLNKRARDEIQITIPDSLEANLSVAVTDDAFATDSTNNIIAHMLLASNVKGYVPHPEYYFKSNSDTVNRHLDLLMLTHGWRRFKWEDVANGKLPVIAYPKDTTYLSLSGKLYGVQPGSTTGGTLALFVKTKDSSSKMLLEPILPNGTFNDPDAIFFDTLQVYYQAQPARMFKNIDVNFMQNRLPPLNYQHAAQTFAGAFFSDTTGNYRQQLLAEERIKVNELMKEKMLANVTVRAKTKTPVQVLDEKYASGLFTGSDSYQFDLVNDPLASSYPDIFSYLQGKVAGLQISTAAGPGGQTSLQWRGGTPAVFLDQMNTDVTMLATVPVTDIAYVKVFQPPFVGAIGGGSGGAIAIYTRKGSDAPVSRSKGLNKNTIMGYTPVREFYSPNYDRIDERNERRDLRATLYWNPAVLLSPRKNKVTLVFYNNDVTKSFRVIIEGITKDGRLAHIEQVME